MAITSYKIDRYLNSQLFIIIQGSVHSFSEEYASISSYRDQELNPILFDSQNYVVFSGKYSVCLN